MNNYHLLNGSNLAYVGDAYYELRVRLYLINKGITKDKELKKASIEYVSANAHFEIYERIKETFTEEEHKIFLRGRNSAPNNHRKNLDRGKYVVSSGLEAVIGYLYLKGDFERLDYLFNLIFEKEEGKC
jgi:ribonuclease-3 family protein